MDALSVAWPAQWVCAMMTGKENRLEANGEP